MKPLVGKTILVTRPKGQAESAVAEFERLGATVSTLPVIEIQPLESMAQLDDALINLDRYDWVVLTSVNGVAAVNSRLEALGISPEKLASKKLAAIGPATAAELARIARAPDVVPSEYVSEAIADALRGQVSARSETGGPTRFLLARADIARKDLANILREMGAEVDEVAAYRIARGHGSQDLPLQAPDYITLTSSSAARATFEILKERGLENWLSSAAIVCIGPITSSTVRELGYAVAAEAKEFTLPGVVAAVTEHARGPKALSGFAIPKP